VQGSDQNGVFFLEKRKEESKMNWSSIISFNKTTGWKIDDSGMRYHFEGYITKLIFIISTV
jgi:hypothetical protein